MKILKEDLRIGNLIGLKLNNKITYSVEAILYSSPLHYSVRLSKIGCIAELKEIKPIPITEEWLRKTEINQMNGVHNSRFSGLISVKYSKSVNKWEFFIGTVSITFIDYLHELQNVWYVLTGEELKIIQ